MTIIDILNAADAMAEARKVKLSPAARALELRAAIRKIQAAAEPFEDFRRDLAERYAGENGEIADEQRANAELREAAQQPIDVSWSAVLSVSDFPGASVDTLDRLERVGLLSVE